MREVSLPHSLQHASAITVIARLGALSLAALEGRIIEKEAWAHGAPKHASPASLQRGLCVTRGCWPWRRGS